MRKLISFKFVGLLAALGLVLGLSSSTQAGVIVPLQSTLAIQLGGLPPVGITATVGTEGLVTLTGDPLHTLTIQPSVWSTVNFGPGTSLFTGVPLISNLKVTVHNAPNPGTITPSFSTVNALDALGGHPTIGPGMGGVLDLEGRVVIFAVNGNIKLPVNLQFVGSLFAPTTMVTLIGNNITATNGPFVTPALKITGVTSNIITIPARGGIQGVGFTLNPIITETNYESVMTLSTNGGFASISGGLALENHMVTVSGTNSLLSASKEGMITLVAPLRIFTGALVGNIPGRAIIKTVFVPEPGTLLLLISGAVGLAVIGRRRMRK